MAIVRAQFPFPSNSNLQFPHDIFLSFRGADTRLEFTDHLYTALNSAIFETYRDDLIDRGEKIYLEAEKAIKNSSMVDRCLSLLPGIHRSAAEYGIIWNPLIFCMIKLAPGTQKASSILDMNMYVGKFK
ncbi:hypothetical protein LguiA_010888 [Lonicera macranthoides]